MKRAEVTKPCAQLTFCQYDKIPQPPQDGVVIKTTYCGICHSDIHMWRGAVDADDPSAAPSARLRFKFPVVYGHEISGTVYSLGARKDEEAEDLEIGDKVAVYPWLGCGGCVDCKSGQTNQCVSRANEIGCGIDGGYSTHVIVNHKRYVVKVPDLIPMDVACMLPCSGLTTYNAVTKMKPTIDKAIERKGGASLLVIGAGGLGLWCLQSATTLLSGETKIVTADVDENKLEVALKYGAGDTILWNVSEDADENDEKELIKYTRSKGSDGFDGVIDLVNSSVTARRALESLRKGGTLVMVGLYGGELTLKLAPTVLSMKRIIPSYTGSISQLKELVSLAATGKVKSPPITHCSLEDVPGKWDELLEGKIVGRSIIKF